MYYVRSLSREYWPAKEIANDLFGHFLSLKFSQNSLLQTYIYTRVIFRDKIVSDEPFGNFWNLVKEMYPEKEEYFASLMDTTKPYEPEWLVKRYNKFRFKKEFEDLSQEEKKSLKEEFANLRPNAFQFALKTEAQRLNCDVSDVVSESPVLPLEPGYDPRFILAALPDEILVKTMSHLDSLDFFNMTRVCKKWKSMVYDNSAELKRAEHAATTHLVTFTNWMDPSKTPSCEAFARQYYQFSWGLVKWCCGISTKLETLIFEHPVSYPNVAALLRSCPNLKNLQLGRNSAHLDLNSSGFRPGDVYLPNLEVYLCTEFDADPLAQEVKMDILCIVDRLQVLRTSIIDKHIEEIQFVRPVTEVFRHLTALDLTFFTDSVLQMLATIPNLELKYLRLGDVSNQHDFNVPQYEIITARYRDAFHQLLPKLRKLEVLETQFVPGVTNETIQLLTDLELNLQFAVLAHSFVRIEPLHFSFMVNKHADPLDPNLMTEFRDGLLLRNADLDLSDFYFLTTETEARDQLLAADIGFTFPDVRAHTTEDYALSGLCYPVMRNRLNINF